MDKISQLAQILSQKSLTISVAESCTGGNLSARLTSLSGASAYFDCGFITYSNQAKTQMLAVKPATLKDFGAVSEQVVLQMTKGVVANSGCDVAVAVSGIAGPDGGSVAKPVGTVCFGFFVADKYWQTSQYFGGSRADIVNQSIDFVLATLINQLG